MFSTKKSNKINKVNKNKNKTQKQKKIKETKINTSSLKYDDKNIVIKFLEMLNTIKLYHWKTFSYAQHKATDELYSSLNEHIDNFVEVMLGKTSSRIALGTSKKLPLKALESLSQLKNEIEDYKNYLINMDNDTKLNIKENSDLLNIRDEILGNLNKFSYLLTLK